MKVCRWPIILVAAVTATPTMAAQYIVKASGIVTLVEGNADGTGPRPGDILATSFLLDDAVASSPTILPIGGGTYTIYNVPLSGFQLSMGDYRFTAPFVQGSLTYADNSFASDAIVIAVDGLSGGPFESSFANVQLQFRGLSTSIDNSGISNGLPLARLTPSFLATFGDGTRVQRVFGTLSLNDTVAVPEPSSWLMMLVGFGGIGFAMRRRKKNVTTTVAFA